MILATKPYIVNPSRDSTSCGKDIVAMQQTTVRNVENPVENQGISGAEHGEKQWSQVSPVDIPFHSGEIAAGTSFVETQEFFARNADKHV